MACSTSWATSLMRLLASVTASLRLFNHVPDHLGLICNHHPHRRQKHTHLPTSSHAYRQAVHTLKNCVFTVKHVQIFRLKATPIILLNTRPISMAGASKPSFREIPNELSLGRPRSQCTIVSCLIG